MSSDRTQTLTVGEDSGPETQPPVPHLVYLLTADRLGASSCRVRLRPDRGSHVFGRGRELGCATSPDGIVVSVPDPRMSSMHARLEPVGSRWRVEDLGSKNGTLVDGLAVDTPRLLADGDLLELGHSFFLYREMVSTWPELDDAPQSLGDEGPVSLSGPLVARYRDLARVAPSDLPVLLRGESGVGKEVAARALHALSGRRGRCVAVNCGALPETLVESELFGVRKGAFSGAHADRKGLVEEAGEGTLFLDEIGELPPSAQTKLLRVLQERCVVPVGATRPVPVNFRLVAATHRDLEKDVREERFRGDLFSRIAGYALVLPPLRERREDLGLLVRQIVAEAG
ncbi:MAG: sigma-54-dependent Fis family transcriptional regulator, partial [Myxococcota bacterium]